MTSSHNHPTPGHWFFYLAGVLDPRSATRFALLLLGVVLAQGRRTLTSWIRAVGLQEQFRCCYTTVSAAARDAEGIAARLLHEVLKPLLVGCPRILLALDDTPTPRYGPLVQGAGRHHNPTPGPAGSPFVYGHVFVVLAVVVAHPSWGVLALPLLAQLYIRAKDLASIDPWHRPPFRTKLELAVQLLRWAKCWLLMLGKPLWVVVDGAYAKAPFLKAALALGLTVVSRLRKDAALFSLPLPRRPGQRGRPRVYGTRRIDLAKRAGQRRGWRTGLFTLYGQAVRKRYKTFLATWRPVGGVIRVVLVQEPSGSRAYFCTDVDASVADILGCVADRFSLETTFKDVKEVVGAGQQPVRFVGASVGAFSMCLWAFSLTEAWAWQKPSEELVEHRAGSPWDRWGRRPSHADKRRAWRREILGEEFRSALRPGMTEQEIAQAAECLLDLAA